MRVPGSTSVRNTAFECLQIEMTVSLSQTVRNEVFGGFTAMKEERGYMDASQRGIRSSHEVHGEERRRMRVPGGSEMRLRVTGSSAERNKGLR